MCIHGYMANAKLMQGCAVLQLDDAIDADLLIFNRHIASVSRPIGFSDAPLVSVTVVMLCAPGALPPLVPATATISLSYLISRISQSSPIPCTYNAFGSI